MSGFDRAENSSKTHPNNVPESPQSWLSDFGNGFIEGLMGRAPHAALRGSKGESIAEFMGEGADVPRRTICEYYQLIVSLRNRSQMSNDAHAHLPVPHLELTDESGVFCKR